MESLAKYILNVNADLLQNHSAVALLLNHITKDEIITMFEYLADAKLSIIQLIRKLLAITTIEDTKRMIFYARDHVKAYSNLSTSLLLQWFDELEYHYHNLRRKDYYPLTLMKFTNISMAASIIKEISVIEGKLLQIPIGSSISMTQCLVTLPGIDWCNMYKLFIPLNDDGDHLQLSFDVTFYVQIDLFGLSGNSQYLTEFENILKQDTIGSVVLYCEETDAQYIDAYKKYNIKELLAKCERIILCDAKTIITFYDYFELDKMRSKIVTCNLPKSDLLSLNISQERLDFLLSVFDKY